jgi:hypothetical protein
VSTVAAFKKPTEDLATLTASWLKLKQTEADAASARLAVEQRMCALLPGPTAECTAVGEVPGFRVSIRYGVSRKVDSDALQAIWDTLPPKAQEAFRWKADVALPKLRALKDYLPAEYTKLAAVVEVKPSKPSVSIDATEAA